MNVRNLCLHFCAETKKRGAGPLSAEELLGAVVSRAQKLCDVASRAIATTWPPKGKAPTGDGEKQTKPGGTEPPTSDGPGSNTDLIEQRSAQVAMLLQGTLSKKDFPPGKKYRYNEYHSLLSTSKQFCLQRDQLYRTSKGSNNLRVLRSWDDVAGTIRKVHVGCGHFGRGPTLDALKGQVWWFGNMEDDVNRIVRACPECQAHNAYNPTKITPPLKHVEYRREHLGLEAGDLKKLPTKAGGRYHALAVVDYFSEYVRGAALNGKHAD